jgi:hypothetical protein
VPPRGGHAAPAHAGNCVVSGLENARVSTKTVAEFTIIAYDGDNRRKRTGGESFFISTRGGSRTRVRVTDLEDGTYTCQWLADMSGAYSIMVSLMGERVRGSPFSVLVCDPAPYAARCEVKGEALNRVIARTPSNFEIRFRDLGGRIAQAVDLDVYVVPLDAEPEEVANGAWEIATRTVVEEDEEEVKGLKEELEEESDPFLGAARKQRPTKGKRAKGKGGRADEGALFGRMDGGGADGGDMVAPTAAGEATTESEPFAEISGAAREELLSCSDPVMTRRRAFQIQVRGRGPTE